LNDRIVEEETSKIHADKHAKNWTGGVRYSTCLAVWVFTFCRRVPGYIHYYNHQARYYERLYRRPVLCCHSSSLGDRTVLPRSRRYIRWYIDTGQLSTWCDQAVLTIILTGSIQSPSTIPRYTKVYNPQVVLKESNYEYRHHQHQSLLHLYSDPISPLRASSRAHLCSSV
jgi:hypothetical protein